MIGNNPHVIQYYGGTIKHEPYDVVAFPSDTDACQHDYPAHIVLQHLVTDTCSRRRTNLTHMVCNTSVNTTTDQGANCRTIAHHMTHSDPHSAFVFEVDRCKDETSGGYVYDNNIDIRDCHVVLADLFKNHAPMPTNPSVHNMVYAATTDNGLLNCTTQTMNKRNTSVNSTDINGITKHMEIDDSAYSKKITVFEPLSSFTLDFVCCKDETNEGYVYDHDINIRKCRVVLTDLFKTHVHMLIDPKDLATNDVTVKTEKLETDEPRYNALYIDDTDIMHCDIVKLEPLSNAECQNIMANRLNRLTIRRRANFDDIPLINRDCFVLLIRHEAMAPDAVTYTPTPNSVPAVKTEQVLSGNEHETKSDYGTKIEHSQAKTNMKKGYPCHVCEFIGDRPSAFDRHMSGHTGYRPYVCSICDVRFASKGNLKLHAVTHTKVRAYKCDICGVSFALKGNLKIHMYRHSDVKPYTCSTCGAGFIKKRQLTEHQITHTTDLPYKCSKCDVAFATRSRLHTHMHTHARVARHRCPHCENTFSQRQYLRIHIMTHTGERPHHCTLCDSRFMTNGALTYHMESHRTDKPHKCELCHFRCTRPSGIERHMITHSDVKSFKCSICSTSFRHKHTLTRHLETHDKDRTMYECPVCNKRVTNKSYLTLHLQIHSDAMPYKCSLCDKKFKYKQLLKVHERVHTGEKRYYKCDICDMRFAGRSYVKIHKRIHTGEKPYKCSVCGHGFRTTGGLTADMRIHTNETPYKCTVCECACVEMSSLKIHHRIHTGVRPYVCTHRTDTFRTNSARRAHVRAVHNNERFNCTLCSYTTKSTRSLKRHVKKCHDTEHS